ncbi:hypothetical protein D3C86_1501440 [compost metagenome]
MAWRCSSFCRAAKLASSVAKVADFFFAASLIFDQSKGCWPSRGVPCASRSRRVFSKLSQDSASAFSKPSVDIWTSQSAWEGRAGIRRLRSASAVSAFFAAVSRPSVTNFSNPASRAFAASSRFWWQSTHRESGETFGKADSG